MFAAKSHGTFICLHCRSRLLQQSLRSARLPYQSFTRLSSSEVTAQDSATSNDDRDALPTQTRKRRGKKPGLSKFPLGKLYGKRGEMLRESSASLNIDTLGTPSEIIILRDAGFTHEEAKKINSTKVDVQKLKGLSKDEILASIQEENDIPPTQEEVNQSITSLQPPKPSDTVKSSYVSKLEYDKLFEQLSSGFTYGQLFRYIKEAHPESGAGLKRHKWTQGPLNVYQWVPGIKPIDQRLCDAATADKEEQRMSDGASMKTFEGKERNTLKAASPKGRLVERILKDCWGVQINEIVDSIGQLDVALNRHSIELLESGGSQNILDEIRDLRRSRIEMYRPNSFIRITADKQIAEYTATDILDKLKNAKTSKFDLAPFLSSLKDPSNFDAASKLDLLLSPDDLRLMTSLSRTIIRPYRKTMLRITGIGQTDVDIARRMLLSALDLPVGRKSLIVANSQTYSNAIIHAASLESTLSLQDRRKNLGRWVLPVPRLSSKHQHAPNDPEVQKSPIQHSNVATLETIEANTTKATNSTSPLAQDAESSESAVVVSKNEEYVEDNQQAKSQKKLYDLLCGAVRTPELDLKSRKDTREIKDSYWAPRPKTEIYSVFGHALHPLSHHRTPDRLLKELETNHRKQRVFSSTLPGLAQSLYHLSELHAPDVFTASSVSLKLLPSPWTKSGHQALVEYPPITLRWHLAPHTKKPFFKSMSAELDSRVIDYLLPDHATDIRFVKRETIFALAEVFLKGNTGARQFVEAVEKSLQSNDLLSAPSVANISIPKWFVGRDSQRRSKEIKADWRTGQETMVEYVPLGFEHRQMMAVNIGNHGLSYVSIEAGAMGGRRGELRLRMRSPTQRQQWVDGTLKPQLDRQYPGSSDVILDSSDKSRDYSSPSQVETTQDFINASFNLASLIHQSGQEDLPKQGDSAKQLHRDFHARRNVANRSTTKIPSVKRWNGNESIVHDDFEVNEEPAELAGLVSDDINSCPPANVNEPFDEAGDMASSKVA